MDDFTTYDFYTYEDIMYDMDDRDDTYDPEYRDPAGYCPHGTYVGGYGADLMCAWCEDGVSAVEAKRIVRMENTRAIRERAERTARLLNDLLKMRECGGIRAARYAQDSRYVANPLNRYGRH